MSRKSEGGHLFIGRLSKNARTRDIEEVFETYGRITRCEIKYGKYYTILLKNVYDWASRPLKLICLPFPIAARKQPSNLCLSGKMDVYLRCDALIRLLSL